MTLYSVHAPAGFIRYLVRPRHRQASAARERAVVLDACLPRGGTGLGELGREVGALAEVRLVGRAPDEEPGAPTPC
jgi:hypothetical protein